MAVCESRVLVSDCGLRALDEDTEAPPSDCRLFTLCVVAVKVCSSGCVFDCC